MIAITYTDFRSHLAESMKEVCSTHKEIIVTTKGNKNNVVVLSQEDYEGLKETVHLLSSPKNAARLMESIKQFNAGKAEKKELQEC